MHVKMVGALIISMYLGKLLPMELPDTITVVSRDAREFVITKDIFSLSNTFLFLLPDDAQETRFHFREFNSDEFEEMLALMAPIVHLQQNGSRRYVKFQKAKEKLWFLSTKSLKELGGLMVIANFLDIDSLQQLIAYFIALQLDPRLSAKDIDDVFEKLNISENENPKKYITKELELKQVSKNPFQKSDRLLFCNQAPGTKRQEIKATILDEGDFSWRKLPVEVQLQMLEMHLLSQTNPTVAAKELLERIRTLTFTDLPIEVKEHIFLYLIKHDETIFQQFKQLSVLSQINRQTCTLLHPHCQALKLAIAQQLVKSNKQQAGSIFLKLCKSKHADIDAVKAFVTSGIDINIKNDNGITALMLASGHGHKEALELLLDKGADVNVADNNGYTALIFASRGGNKEIIELLLDRGVDVDAVDNYGYTALTWAFRQDHKEIVRLLLDKGADINKQNNNDDTALIHASQEGRTELVKLLLDKGADVNAEDKRGFTALMLASQEGRTEVVKLLLDKHARDNVKAKDGLTALMLASKNGHKEIVKLLEVRAIGFHGFNASTALMLASQRGRTDLVKHFLDNHADVNARDEQGATALMWASREGHLQIVKLLIDRGADVNAENRNFDRASTWAYLNHRTEVAEFLLVYGRHF